MILKGDTSVIKTDNEKIPYCGSTGFFRYLLRFANVEMSTIITIATNMPI